MIISVEPSRRKMKRLKVTMDDGKEYHFGLDGGSTYLEHTDKTIRENYRKRHLGNETERRLIENLVPSPALFAYYLLWGPYTDLDQNVKHLNNLWKKKHQRG